METVDILFRDGVFPEDIENVRRILTSSGFFRQAEIDVGIELVTETLKKENESSYYFIFLEYEGKTVGYSCYGEIPCTVSNFDLYWIAVDNHYRGKGLGHLLMEKTENVIRSLHGRGIYVETSEKEQYQPTLDFYRSAGFELLYIFKDYYEMGDHKAVFYKRL